jgi:hypothetical protein
MAAADYLNDYFSQLTDEELLDQLAGHRLSEDAAPLARKELASRGIDAAQVTARLRAERARQALQAHQLERRRHNLLRRSLHFPLRAVLGLESPWPVLFAGAAIIYLAYRGLLVAASLLLAQRPLPGYALPGAYLALGVFGLACLWFATALWRCGRRAGSTPALWFARSIAALVAAGSLYFVGTLIPALQRAAGLP